jgi:Asp-tRNA(Asn)/Glu-tRNA(Gln) amidotransferase A subunit family amidase
MSNILVRKSTRRRFAGEASLVVGAALTGVVEAQVPAPQQPTPGAPPAFGTSPAVGPEVTTTTFAEAEKLVQAPLSAKDRAEAAGNWRQSMAALYERRVGPKKLAIPDAAVPYAKWDPLVPGAPTGPKVAKERTSGIIKEPITAPLPATDAEIAMAPLMHLQKWIFAGEITSERLTTIYLERIAKYNGTLRCVITATPEIAMGQARAADKLRAKGVSLGPLHGIPWGGKDLLDTAGIRTTYGAEFYRDRVPAKNAAVVDRLNRAGAVMVAKLSMGALALNDVWFGGQTMNPWLLEEGSSGSSAGPGAATAAGLVGFSIGSETGGSIVSPSMRCGVTGLRPTFGRVPRSGAMTLCWSLDKLGPMTRGVEDSMMVLKAISGTDAGDLSSVDWPVVFDREMPVEGLRVGYFPGWMKEAPATDVDRNALAVMEKLGMKAVPVTLPDWPYDSMQIILFAEAAAAFEEQTLDGRLDQLKMQVPDAWPNSFRQARFLSAVDMVQADRMRRMVAMEMVRVMKEVDVLLVPSLRDEMLTLTNFTGHPSLTFRAGFVEVGEARSDWAPDPARPLPKFNPKRRVPHGVTLIGRLFDEGTIVRVGRAMEKELGVSGEGPKGF